MIECFEHNERLMERFEWVDQKFPNRIFSIQTSRQPYVVKYGVDALMEEMNGRVLKPRLMPLTRKG
jgi:hypothetical protein